jgi:hypothetical protein
MRRHVAKRFEHTRLGVPTRVCRPRFALGETRLDIKKLLTLLMTVRDDQARMVCARGVELHAPELQHLRNDKPRLLQLRVGAFEIHLAVIRPAVVGRDHPAEPEVFRHQRIHVYRIDRIPPEYGRGRLLFAVPARAVAAVDVMIAGDPLIGLFCGKNARRKEAAKTGDCER